VLVGMERPDDAGIFKLGDDLALVQTVDFFTPVVDDPFDFGRIAAANALSDVYAMGGRPLCAMNIVCFPSGTMELEVLRRILHGGVETLREAAAPLVGGHSVEDAEIKYGLAVTGVVDPARYLTSAGARPGDRLLLTKPLGTGIVAKALKSGRCSDTDLAAAVESMAALNRTAAEAILEHRARACTDVTGFGLAGHLMEMLEGSDLDLALDASALPLLPGAEEYAARGLVTAGLRRNREFAGERLRIDPGVPGPIGDLVVDPQTSGGLLAALPADEATACVEALRSRGCPQAALVGEFTERGGGVIHVRG
jgi:selenide,water dikinase